MKVSTLQIYLIPVILFVALIMATKSVSGFQPVPTDVNNLRRLLTKSVGQEFEIVKDEMKHRPGNTRDDYWLVRIKPKRSGFYALKYTYKIIKPAYDYDEESEHTFSINVEGKKCYRRTNSWGAVSNICLGDTFIIPIRTVNATAHTFSLKSRSQKAGSLEDAQKYYNSQIKYSAIQPQFNQLESNVKLLGIRRSEMPYRSCCRVAVDYHAVFEAVKPGRFNLGFSSFEGNNIPDNSVKMNSQDGKPIIIVNHGTPITTLIPSEETIDYSDNKRFSSHAGNSFVTNLLILQPGDVFTLLYAKRTLEYGFGTKTSERPKMPDIKPAVYKLPFLIDKEWSFNEWILDSLPKDK